MEQVLPSYTTQFPHARTEGGGEAKIHNTNKGHVSLFHLLLQCAWDIYKWSQLLTKTREQKSYKLVSSLFLWLDKITPKHKLSAAQPKKEKNMKIRALMLLLSLFVVACNPFKVTDPNDPRFDVTKFDLNDYKSHTELAEVMRILFKVGTTKDEVDRVLVEYGQAKMTDVANLDNILGSHPPAHINLPDLQNRSTYIHMYGKQGKLSNWGWRILIFYDENKKVIQILSDDKFVF